MLCISTQCELWRKPNATPKNGKPSDPIFHNVGDYDSEYKDPLPNYKIDIMFNGNFRDRGTETAVLYKKELFSILQRIEQDDDLNFLCISVAIESSPYKNNDMELTVITNKDYLDLVSQ
jgi:hypothetical protein